MKIEHKIKFSYIFAIIFIISVGLLSFRIMNQVLSKLRFVEIADDLNASFLEMRIAEKNYFLYKDQNVLVEITDKVTDTIKTVDTMKPDIIRAIGGDNFQKLDRYLLDYAATVDKIKASRTVNPSLQPQLRSEGQKMHDFFKQITRAERELVNNLIQTSNRIILSLFLGATLIAIISGSVVSKKILKSLRAIQNLAISISKGNFTKIEDIKASDECGYVIKAINYMSDELKTREEEMIQSKKLASLGILTAGVAHELTNPLNNISMISQNFLELYDNLSKEVRMDLMAKVAEETKRIESIVRNLLDFSKPREANLQRADINDTIRNVVRLMQNTLDISNVELKLTMDPGIPKVMIDENQIQQVLVNLIINAVQAMGPGGKLFVDTKFAANDGLAKIVVRDTGKGIAPEYLPHIFDPFFSTKGVGGTGLGLSVSYGIIKQHNGKIRAESVVDGGATFTIELPIAKKKAKGEKIDETL